MHLTYSQIAETFLFSSNLKGPERALKFQHKCHPRAGTSINIKPKDIQKKLRTFKDVNILFPRLYGHLNSLGKVEAVSQVYPFMEVLWDPGFWTNWHGFHPLAQQTIDKSRKNHQHVFNTRVSQLQQIWGQNLKWRWERGKRHNQHLFWASILGTLMPKTKTKIKNMLFVCICASGFPKIGTVSNKIIPVWKRNSQSGQGTW